MTLQCLDMTLQNPQTHLAKGVITPLPLLLSQTWTPIPQPPNPDLPLPAHLTQVRDALCHGNLRAAGHSKPSYFRIQEIARPRVAYVHDPCKAAKERPSQPQRPPQGESGLPPGKIPLPQKGSKAPFQFLGLLNVSGALISSSVKWGF